MATNSQTVSIRLVVADGGAVKAELRDVGVVGEQSLQRIDQAAGNTSRTLTVIDANAASASRSLVVLDNASGGVTRSLTTANDNAARAVSSFDAMTTSAERTSKAVAAIPRAFEILAALVAVDAAVHAVGLLRDVIGALGKELIDQGRRFHEWAKEADGATGSTARYLEYVVARQAALKGLEMAGASYATRALVGTAASGVYLTAETVGALADASKLARDYAAAQKALAAELDRTGYASQRTAGDIAKLSTTLGEGSRFSAAEIANTARELLKFRSVTGDVFDRAVKVSADLAVKLGTDLPAAANLLGKALDDPARAASDLAEKGINLTFAQQSQAKAFADSGDKAKAQGVILDAVSTKTGDAASKMTDAERATKTLDDAFDRLYVTIGTRLNKVLDDLADGIRTVGHAFDNVLGPLKELLAGGMNSLSVAITADPIEKQLSDVSARLETAKKAYSAAVSGSDIDETARLGMDVEILERKRAGLEAQAAAAKRRRDDEQREIGQRQTDDRAQRFAGERGNLDKQLEAVIKPGTDDQIKRVNAELEKTRQRLEALRAPDGGNKAEIDRAIADAERVAKAKAKAIQEAGKTTDGARSTDDAVDRQIEALREERDALGLTARERAVHTALLRAEQTARQSNKALTQDQAETIQFEAGALYDARTASDAHNKAMAEGARLMAQFASPSESVASELIHLQDLLEQGAIGWKTFAAASDKAMERMNADGGKTSNVARDIGMSFTSAFENAALSGQKLSSVLGGLAQDLARLALRKSITEPLFNALGGSLGGLFSGGLNPAHAALTGIVPMMTPLGYGVGFHEGGIAGGTPTFTRSVPESTWSGAPRYHTGGIVPGEVPAILKRGEGVFTPEQMAALGNGGGSVINQNVTVNVERSGGAGGADNDAEFAAMIGNQVKAQMRGMMAEEMRQQMRPGGMLRGGY